MLSVIVLTLDEVKHIQACLDSVRDFADELLVFDSAVDARVVELAKASGARVVQRKFDNYAAQRNAAMQAALGDWIFFMDADERADALVGKEIRRAIAQIQDTLSNEVLFWIPRKNYIFGKWIQHTGWSPDYQPRVLKKGKAWFDPARPVHELVIAQGGELFLTNPLTHFNYETLAQFRTKQQRYTRYEAQSMVAEGLRPRRRSYISMPLREFLRRFVSLQGYRDGLHGLGLSLLMAYYAFWRQVWAAELTARK
ncbi:MAG: glycosyltransferase family 2 protein [Chloroflexi bacterium]|nr:glycosyltransferase family 2 protein [Chloroflexota bacterium]